MKSHLLKVLVLLSMCFSLTACPENPLSNLGQRADDSCRMSFKTAGGWSIAGITIPLTKAPDGSKIQIGNTEFKSDEAYQLTETAELFEQSRLSICAVINSRGFPSMSDTYKAAILNKSLEVSDKMIEFGNKVKSATTVDQALAAANEGKTAAKQAKEQTAIPPQASDINMINNLSDKLNNFTVSTKEQASKVDQAIIDLHKEIESWRALPQSTRIEIAEFPMGAVSLPAEAREQLTSKVQTALDKVPSQQQAIVVVVGYADKTGSQLNNVNIGLRRAQIVVSYLQQQRFLRSFESHAVSGGIDEKKNGRHVAVFVSGNIQV